MMGLLVFGRAADRLAPWWKYGGGAGFDRVVAREFRREDVAGSGNRRCFLRE
jgi:hypothetical protein